MDIYVDLSKYEGAVRRCLSRSVQQHAFIMGIKWIPSGNKIVHTEYPYIILRKDNDITFLLCGDEYNSHDKLISVSKFLDMEISPFIQNKSDVIFADFSWVKGISRTVLIERCLQIARRKDYEYKSFTTEF